MASVVERLTARRSGARALAELELVHAVEGEGERERVHERRGHDQDRAVERIRRQIVREGDVALPWFSYGSLSGS